MKEKKTETETETESAWNKRVAKERPPARSQPKFPWQVKPDQIDPISKDQDSETGTQKDPVTGTQKDPVTGTQKDPVTKNVTGTQKVTDTQKVPVATFRIAHQELEYLLEKLDGIEFKLYLRLYRLSHGWGKENCKVGDNNLMATLNISRNALRTAKRSLINKKLIEVIKTVNLGPNGFTEYRVIRVGEQSEENWYLKGTSTQKVTDTQKDPIKEDHDHDDLKKDHQRKTMMIYQSLTGNKWKKNDDRAYEQIKDISLEQIEQGINLAKQRSASRPNSLNYFVKEIINLARPSEQSKTQHRNSLEKIVNTVRELHVGERNYKLPDLIEDVKRAAAREGIAFDNDLLNKILNL
jgi:hypothetical protein